MSTLTLNKIAQTIIFMDETYDANFGEWIRNEENARIVGYNLKKYLHYKIDDIILVLKWIVKDWTLRSIIILIKRMLIDEFNNLYEKKIEIIRGLVYTWNAIFIGEMIISIIKNLKGDEKTRFVKRLLRDFDRERVDEMVKVIGGKVDVNVKKVMMKWKGKRGGVKEKIETQNYN